MILVSNLAPVASAVVSELVSFPLYQTREKMFDIIFALYLLSVGDYQNKESFRLRYIAHWSWYKCLPLLGSVASCWALGGSWVGKGIIAGNSDSCDAARAGLYRSPKSPSAACKSLLLEWGRIKTKAPGLCGFYTCSDPVKNRKLRAEFINQGRVYCFFGLALHTSLQCPRSLGFSCQLLPSSHPSYADISLRCG